MKIPSMVIIALIVMVAWGMWYERHIRRESSIRAEIIQLTLDKEEIKKHTDLLAGIVRDQQFQIDTLIEMVDK
jgi:hypothetical protein